MYAVIRTGGRQYRVEPGQRLRVGRLPGEQGDTVQLGEVLMVGENGKVTIGTPTVPGVQVVAEIVSQGRDKKVSVFKYKSKTRYRRLRGHRQHHTVLAIQAIGGPEVQPAPRAEAPAAGPVEATAEAGDEATVDEPPRRRTPARKTTSARKTTGARKRSSGTQRAKGATAEASTEAAAEAKPRRRPADRKTTSASKRRTPTKRSQPKKEE